MTDHDNATDGVKVIRTVTFERDVTTNAQSVMDIRENGMPAKSDNRSWTSLSRDADAAKRALLLELSRQIDQLAAGEIDEIRLHVNG
jgi:hypothetical protein